jgi:hypothetical protein
MAVSVRTVDSSNILSIGYDSEASELRVVFANGGVYSYEGVSQEAYEKFIAADSKGAYLAKHIKAEYPGRKVEEQFIP